MKFRPIHIIIFLLGLIVISSPTCEDPDDRENAYVKENGETITDEQVVFQTKDKMIRSLKEEFGANFLSDNHLRAFEQRAKEKILDFADYTSIYSNKEYDKSFRKQARRMMLNLFADKNAKINFSFVDSQRVNDYTLPNFMDEIYTAEYNALGLNIGKIEIAEPLHLQENTTYEGSVKFSQQLYGITLSDTVLINSGVGYFEIIAIRVDKKFGTDSLQVWEVLLGDLR